MINENLPQKTGLIFKYYRYLFKVYEIINKIDKTNIINHNALNTNPKTFQKLQREFFSSHKDFHIAFETDNINRITSLTLSIRKNNHNFKKTKEVIIHQS